MADRRGEFPPWSGIPCGPDCHGPWVVIGDAWHHLRADGCTPCVPPGAVGNGPRPWNLGPHWDPIAQV